jgi:Uncharacterized conserved protein
MTFDRLAQDGISFKVTISLTPPLLEMMKTKSLQEKFLTHVTQLIELCDKEIVHARTLEEKELSSFLQE